MTRFRSALLSLFLVFGSLNALSQSVLPEEAFFAFQEDAKHFVDYLQYVEKSWPNAVAPLLNRLNGNPEPWYRPQFDLLLKVATPVPPDKQRVDWVFSKWPAPFAALALQLRDGWKATRNTLELQPTFFNVHDTYAHAIPAAYLLIAGVKEKVIEAPWGPSFPSRAQRDLAVNQVVNLHLWAQRVMRWMHDFRVNPDYAGLHASPYFEASEDWETRYALNFFYGMSPDAVLSAVEDLGLFFIPVAAAEEWKQKLAAASVKLVPVPGLPPVVAPTPKPPVTPPTNPPTNPPVTPPTNPPVTPPVTPPAKPGEPTIEELKKEYEELQRKLTDPKNQDDPKLRQRLWELQKLLNPTTPGPTTPPAPTAPTTPAPQNPTPTEPPANPAPSTPNNPAPQPPVNPGPVKPTDPNGPPAPQPPAPAPVDPKSPNAAAIERIQAMLKTPEVQGNAQLKQQLEDLLKQLQGAPATTTPPPVIANAK